MSLDSEQADLSASSTTDDLARFLVDNPTADLAEDDETPDAPELDSDNADGQNDDRPDDATDPDEVKDPDDETDAKAPKTPTSDEEKLKITVKGEDGAEKEIALSKKEIAESYMRHADYTRKTQELGERERQAHEVVSKRADFYMREAATARAAINALAGLKSDQEMFELSRQDQAAWVQETQRAAAVRGLIQSIEQGMSAEDQRRDQQTKEQAAQEYQRAWGVLGKEGLNKEKLAGIFDKVHEKYGVPKEKFGLVSDPALVLIMRDAVAFRDLQTKADAAKKAKPAQGKQMPAPRQNVPQAEQASKRLNQRFKSGKANTRDLASFLMANEK